MEINLSDHRPIKWKPYTFTETNRAFMREKVGKQMANKVCRYWISPYRAAAFVIEQSFHVSTPSV